LLVVIFIFWGMMYVSVAHAALTIYTDQASFLSATSSFNMQNRDLEAISAGTVLPSGSIVSGITFTCNLSGFNMQVLDTYDTTSGKNYSGTGGDGIFIAGDAFTMNFSQKIRAVGLFIISGDIIINGDFSLETGAGSVVNSNITDSTFGTLGDGGHVFFLGLVETGPSQGFSSVTFKSGLNGGDYTFNIDDIMSAVVPPVIPDPPTAGQVGDEIILNGSNFGASQGTSYVDLNGIHGTITSWSDTQIAFTIPVSATSGCLKIVTYYGESNCVEFTVSRRKSLPFLMLLMED